MKWKTCLRHAGLLAVNHLYAGPRCFAQKRRILNAIGFDLGEGTKVVGPLFCTGMLITGKNCWIGRNLTIHGDGQVIIGSCCDLGPDVTILTGGHTIGGPERRAGKGQTCPVRIGDGCWIGARSTLLGGTTLGTGSVIGACACVTKDVPANTLFCGVPARQIRVLYETEQTAE